MTLTDALVIVLIADASKNAMTAEYTLVTDGRLLAATIIFWSYAFYWLGFHMPWLERWAHPPALPLVKDGHALHRNLRQELITEQEFMNHLRQQRIDDLSPVKSARIDVSGRWFTVTECEGS